MSPARDRAGLPSLGETLATEIYKGRKIVTRTRRGRDGREAYATVNGVEATSTYFHNGALDKVADYVRATIDFVDTKPVDGGKWPIHWYDPKTVELCSEGLHPKEIGGKCTHPTCESAAA